MHTEEALPTAKASESDVPVLDFSPVNDGSDLQALASELRRACLNTGFFYVSNHGIPQDLIDGMFDTAERYFALPEEQRRRHLMDERFRRGYVPFGVSKHPGYEADAKERFEWGVDTPMNHPLVRAGKPLYGPNKWPDELPWFREPVERFGREVSALGMRVLRVIALSLNMPENFFEDKFDPSCTTHGMIHYPPQIGENPREFGATEHTDYGLLTLLVQDPIGGLEIRKRTGEWIAAPHIPGTFVINIADLFKVWTNDVYVSNLHRVINRSGRERYSFPTFLNMAYDTLVETLPTCVSPEQPQKHEPIKAGDYLLGRFRTVQSYKI